MSLRVRLLFMIIGLLFLGRPAAALQLGAIHVPADYPTIQAAINAAANGDTIQVAPGTYVENLSFLGKAIRLFSDQGSEVTVIDGNQAGPVVSFTSGEGPQSVLRGFTLRNGKAGVSPALRGGGIRIENSSPTIIGNVITGNTAGDGGGGISSSFGSPLIQENVITNNGQIPGWSGGVGGGGVAIGGASSAQLLKNTISGNSWSASGGGVTLFAAGTPSLQNNFITNNTAYSQGGGVWIVNYSDASIVQNIIVGNSASTGGGVYWLVPSGRRGPFLINNTISGNNSSQGSAVFADGFDAQAQLINNILVSTNTQTAVVCGTFDASAPIFRFNDVLSTAGLAYGGTCSDQTGSNGNISADPQFVGAAAGNFHLQAGSPAIDSGTSNGAPATDLDGVPRPADGNGDGIAAFDMGAYEAQQVDVTPPLTTAAAAPVPNSAGWNQTDTTVTLHATDSGSGVQSISYSLSGAQTASTVTTSTPALVSITAEGTTTVGYSAVDNAGNHESLKSFVVNIDKTAPVTTAAGTPSPNSAGWNQTNTTVTLTATDSGSGVQSIHYSLSGAQSSSGVISGDQALVPITAEGSTTVSYWAVDIAGNSENSKSVLINIDRTVPVISGMPAPNCTLSPPKHQLVQVANITASDALSGVATLTVTATSSEPDSGTGGGDVAGDIVINGGIVQLRAERSPSGKGRTYTINATAVDVAGNVATSTATCQVPK